PSVATLRRGQRRVVGELFDALFEWVHDAWEKPTRRSSLPVPLLNLVITIRGDKEARELAGEDREPLEARTVADYISMLTEAQAVSLHRRLTGTSSGSALENWVRR